MDDDPTGSATKSYTVYTYRDGDGNPLYVNHTDDLRRSEAHHRSSSAWFPLVASTTTETFGRRSDALSRAAEVLVSLDPPFNRPAKRAAPRRTDRRFGWVRFPLSEEADRLLTELAGVRGFSRTAVLEILIREASGKSGDRREVTDA